MMHPEAPSLSGFLRTGLAGEAARPFVTYYDDSTSERVELSWTTTANWVAKSANFLRDGLAVQPGDRIALLLPAHWQTAALLLASAAVGAVSVLRNPDGGAAALASATGAEVVFARADVLVDVLARRPGEVVGLSLAPMGGRLGHLPTGATDYAVEVPAYGDSFVAVPADEQAAGLDLDGSVVAGNEVAAAALATAVRWSLAPTDRVLSTLGWSTWDGLYAGLLAPLAAGASTVLSRPTDPAALARRLAAERVTAIVGQQPPFGSAVRHLAG